MHTFTSLNWLASHPPESSHPVREKTGDRRADSNINVAAIFISDIKETQSEILEISQHTCVAPHLISQSVRRKGKLFQTLVFNTRSRDSGAGSAELPRRGTRDSAPAPAGSQGSFNLAAK